MTRKIPIRPDGIDKAILACVHRNPDGVVVPELYDILPQLRENSVRYRVSTLEKFGFLRCERILGRVILYPVDKSEVTV